MDQHTRLFHVTSKAKLPLIAQDGMWLGSYWSDNLALAGYYAETVEDEGEDPVVLETTLGELQKISSEALSPDLPGIAEPITTIVGRLEDAIHEGWENGDKSWQASLKLIGSLQFNAPIPPSALRQNDRLLTELEDRGLYISFAPKG